MNQPLSKPVGLAGASRSPEQSPRARWVTERFFGVLTQRLEEARRSGNESLSEEIARRLQSAVVVLRDDILTSRVQFGVRVTVFAIEECEEQTFEIVSEDEAELSAGRMGCETPLALALYGAREGDEIDVRLPGGSECSYEVTDISLPDR